MFIWQRPEWPDFRYDARRLLEPLGAARAAYGRLSGVAAALSASQRRDLDVESRVESAVETAAIEGDLLDRESVRSSIGRRLGLASGSTADLRTEGVTAMLFDASENARAPLNAERLFAWHVGLFPIRPEGRVRIAVGALRDDATGPMQVVSGRIDAPTAHFEAPPAERLPEELDRFFRWFAEPAAEDGLVHAALAHLRFVTLHPFDDGNGRIGRAIADLALARAEPSPQLTSMTAQISREKRAYYAELERAQRGDLEVTAWVHWFLACYERAQRTGTTTVDRVLARARYWDRARGIALTDRRRTVLARLLEDDWTGFLTAPKYAKLAHVSDDTAARDIAALVAGGLLERNPGAGKNTSYRLAGTAEPIRSQTPA